MENKSARDAQSQAGAATAAIVEAYTRIQSSTLATVSGEMHSASVFVSYFAVRRGQREKIIGPDGIRAVVKSAEPLLRAAGAAAIGQVLGPKSIEYVPTLLRDPNPVVVEATLDALSELPARAEIGKNILDALSRTAPTQRHKAIRMLGRLKYRPAVSVLEDLFHRRDGIEAPVACFALADIQGRSFLEGITEFLYPDNPIDLHTAILECMAENPAPVYFEKARQLLKSIRNKAAVLEIVRRMALWSADGVALSIKLLGNADLDIADAAQEGLLRHLRTASSLSTIIFQHLTKSVSERTPTENVVAAVPLPPNLENLDARLDKLFSARPDAEFQQLLFLSLTADKHFMKNKLIQLSAARWGKEASQTIEEALTLPQAEAGLIRLRLQTRWAAQAEEESFYMSLARLIDCIGASERPSIVKELVRHLDSAHLPVQMSVVAALAALGGSAEAAEIERRLPRAHWMLKRKMAAALARLTGDATSSKLFDLCEDPEPLVRISAVRSLDGIRHPKAFEALIKSLSDSDERVRSAACACLKTFPDKKEVYDRLTDMLKDTDARVRANTVESLEKILADRPEELSRRLRPLVTDPNARVVINAAKALFPIETALALPVLEAYLRAPDTNLRAGALWAFGQLKRPDAFLCLHFHSLQEKDPYVRTFINRGISLMKDHPFYQDARYLLMNMQTNVKGGSP